MDKKRDKQERKIFDTQEQAFWDVYRPPPGCINTTELDIKKVCKLQNTPPTSWFWTSYPDFEHPILISNIYPDFEHPFKKIDYPLKKSKDFCYLILNLHTFNLTKIICNRFQNGSQNGFKSPVPWKP